MRLWTYFAIGILGGVILATLAGCNTVNGIARDLEGLSKGIAERALE